MNAPSYFQFPQCWNSQDLTDAVPLRLHEMFDFDAHRDGVEHAANVPSQTRRTRGYLSTTPLPQMFRIH